MTLFLGEWWPGVAGGGRGKANLLLAYIQAIMVFNMVLLVRKSIYITNGTKRGRKKEKDIFFFGRKLRKESKKQVKGQVQRKEISLKRK